MTNRAAIRWCLKGSGNPPVIQYMLLDSKLDYLIYPKECIVYDVKDTVYQVIEDIESHSLNTPLEIYYKSINEGYGRHRRDSGQFHRFLKKLLNRKNLLKANHRLAFVLKKEQLKLFKDALYFLDIDSKSRGNAFIVYLWMIALKATRSRVTHVIKQIWKARLSIHRMNKMHEKMFEEFYSLIHHNK
ncbi:MULTISPECIES: hypothetical protein [Legionella]|uniref:Uncharacterized protein n=1 Tax=Legionella resiliens TaxID=2905958 RepID=A0ABS8X0U5_9GAMM|nr:MULTISPECIES: hypothetical protein [unclassified Legionella]MCE0723200.1 hypothetical protein [Legionella sp. 9fVS26]MCE3532353.1 hypothetical protein [Legionella sp. 8cVS16]QLZ68493.1 hypothetical protein FOLKNPGA_01272 [Legionella sp. PC1000]